MEALERDLKGVQQTYGDNMLNLMLARGSIKQLPENRKVVRFLDGNCRDMLLESESLAAAEGV